MLFSRRVTLAGITLLLVFGSVGVVLSFQNCSGGFKAIKANAPAGSAAASSTGGGSAALTCSSQSLCNKLGADLMFMSGKVYKAERLDPAESGDLSFSGYIYFPPQNGTGQFKGVLSDTNGDWRMSATISRKDGVVSSGSIVRSKNGMVQKVSFSGVIQNNAFKIYTGGLLLSEGIAKIPSYVVKGPLACTTNSCNGNLVLAVDSDSGAMSGVVLSGSSGISCLVPSVTLSSEGLLTEFAIDNWNTGVRNKSALTGSVVLSEVSQSFKLQTVGSGNNCNSVGVVIDKSKDNNPINRDDGNRSFSLSLSGTSNFAGTQNSCDGNVILSVRDSGAGIDTQITVAPKNSEIECTVLGKVKDSATGLVKSFYVSNKREDTKDLVTVQGAQGADFGADYSAASLVLSANSAQKFSYSNFGSGTKCAGSLAIQSSVSNASGFKITSQPSATGVTCVGSDISVDKGLIVGFKLTANDGQWYIFTASGATNDGLTFKLSSSGGVANDPSLNRQFKYTYGDSQNPTACDGTVAFVSSASCFDVTLAPQNSSNICSVTNVKCQNGAVTSFKVTEAGVLNQYYDVVASGPMESLKFTISSVSLAPAPIPPAPISTGGASKVDLSGTSLAAAGEITFTKSADGTLSGASKSPNFTVSNIVTNGSTISSFTATDVNSNKAFKVDIVSTPDGKTINVVTQTVSSNQAPPIESNLVRCEKNEFVVNLPTGTTDNSCDGDVKFLIDSCKGVTSTGAPASCSISGDSISVRGSIGQLSSFEIVNSVNTRSNEILVECTGVNSGCTFTLNPVVEPGEGCGKASGGGFDAALFTATVTDTLGGVYKEPVKNGRSSSLQPVWIKSVNGSASEKYSFCNGKTRAANYDTSKNPVTWTCGYATCQATAGKAICGSDSSQANSSRMARKSVYKSDTSKTCAPGSHLRSFPIATPDKIPGVSTGEALAVSYQCVPGLLNGGSCTPNKNGKIGNACKTVAGVDGCTDLDSQLPAASTLYVCNASLLKPDGSGCLANSIGEVGVLCNTKGDNSGRMGCTDTSATITTGNFVWDCDLDQASSGSTLTSVKCSLPYTVASNRKGECYHRIYNSSVPGKNFIANYDELADDCTVALQPLSYQAGQPGTIDKALLFVQEILGETKDSRMNNWKTAERQRDCPRFSLCTVGRAFGIGGYLGGLLGSAGSWDLINYFHYGMAPLVDNEHSGLGSNPDQLCKEFFEDALVVKSKTVWVTGQCNNPAINSSGVFASTYWDEKTKAVFVGEGHVKCDITGYTYPPYPDLEGDLGFLWAPSTLKQKHDINGKPLWVPGPGPALQATTICNDTSDGGGYACPIPNTYKYPNIGGGLLVQTTTSCGDGCSTDMVTHDVAGTPVYPANDFVVSMTCRLK